ncbi:unnamed protein product, partial [marine sediment metagenome]
TNFDSSVIADYIKKTLDQGVKPNEIVVLSRIHILLNKLSQELESLGVPHEKIGRKLELTNSEGFRRFHAFLKLMVNPYDNFGFLLIRELLGISRESYDKIRLIATQEGKSHFQEWWGKISIYEDKKRAYFAATKTSAIYPAELWKAFAEELNYP